MQPAPPMRRLTLLAALALTGALGLAVPAAVPGVRAQTVAPPVEPEAESTFEQALAAFNAGDYGMAYRRFRLVYTGFPLHQKTTAAVFMAARSQLRAGETAAGADLLRDLLRQFPDSRYAADARTLLARLDARADAPRTFTVGVALPLGGSNTALTQAFFNGLRLAVDEHNAGTGSRARLVFRDTDGTAEGARTALEALREVDVVVGPLFSPEAIAAGEVAERNGTTLVAPLATDGRVAEGRRFVFQANPSLAVRGRTMARYAREELRADTFGVVYEPEAGGVSERLGRAFADEVQRGGGVLAFQTPLGSRSWSGLGTQTADADALRSLDALYLPVSGGNAEVDIRAALGALDRSGASPVVLGDAEWHNRPSARALADRFGVTYTNDFVVDDARPEVARFRERYRALAGRDLAAAPFTVQRLAFTGYDLARYLLDRLDGRGNRPLPDALRRADRYDGLGIRLDFDDANVNDALFIQRYRAGAIERLE